MAKHLILLVYGWKNCKQKMRNKYQKVFFTPPRSSSRKSVEPGFKLWRCPLRLMPISQKKCRNFSFFVPFRFSLLRFGNKNQQMVLCNLVTPVINVCLNCNRYLSPLAAVPIVTLAGLGLFYVGFPGVSTRHSLCGRGF